MLTTMMISEHKGKGVILEDNRYVLYVAGKKGPDPPSNAQSDVLVLDIRKSAKKVREY